MIPFREENNITKNVEVFPDEASRETMVQDFPAKTRDLESSKKNKEHEAKKYWADQVLVKQIKIKLAQWKFGEPHASLSVCVPCVLGVASEIPPCRASVAAAVTYGCFVASGFCGGLGSI